MSFNHEYLLRRLDGIEQAVGPEWNNEWADVKDDLEGLLEEVLAAERENLDFNAIASKLEARRAVNIPMLERMQGLFVELGLKETMAIGARVIEPDKCYSEMAEGIETLKHQLAELDDVRAGFVMHQVGSAANSLLYAAIVMRVVPPTLADHVRAQLDLLVEGQVVALWIAVQKELDPEAMTSLKYFKEIIPPAWLGYESWESTKAKLTEYAVRLKPTILIEMARRGSPFYPAKVPDLVDILSWRSANAAERPSEQEKALATSMQRLATLMKSAFSRDESDLSLALGLIVGSSLLRPKAAFSMAAKENAPALRRICYEMRKQIELTRFLATRHSSIQVTIHQYKLGLEIMAPSITTAYADKDELTLQREVAKFLVERGIYAVGTKFGSRETDLVISEHPEHFVIEVKLYKSHASVNPGSLKKALVQLQSYMDGPPTHPLGILLIFNCSNCQLSAPRVWLRERYWIVVINIQEKSPSERSKSVTVEEGDETETIRIHTVPSGRSRSKEPL